MLAELAPNLTPFRYCFNNPINFTDPYGLWEKSKNGFTTDKKEDIERFMDYLSVENNSNKNNPSISEMSTFIDGEMQTGGLGSLSDGSKLAKGFKIEGKRDFSGIRRWETNQKSYDNFWHSVQGDLRPDILDRRILGQNLFWTSYAGGDNPRKYNGLDDYSYNPTSRVEQAAIKHDKFYDKLGIKGFSGLFGDKRVIKADWTYVYENIAVGADPFQSPINRVRGYLLGVGLGAIALPKTIEAFMPTMVNPR